MTSSDNLFRFMAVRPPQKIAAERLRRRFIRYDAAGLQPQLYEELMARDTLPARRQLAATFTIRDAYVTGWSHDAPWVAGLRRLLQALRAATQPAALEAIRQQAASWAAEHKEQLGALKSQLWSSLYAATLSPRSRPHDRKELIDLIRALHFVEHHDDFETRADVAALLRAQPLVPEELFSAPPADPEPGDGPDPPGGPTRQQKKRELFEQLQGRLAGLQNAIVDIETVERRFRRRAPEPGGAAPQPAAGDDGQTQTSTSPRTGSWRLPAAALEALDPKTRAVVGDERLSLEADSTVDILNGLEGAQRRYYGAIYKLGGLPAVKTAGLLQSGLDEDMVVRPRSTDIPWYYQKPGKRFDETIKGAVGSVRPVGIGDLLIVKETIWKYALGEVAHIENVLQAESKERVHRRLDRTEQTFFTETETTKQSVRDLQTTERFELQTEVQRTLQRETEIGLGLEVSGGYGPVKVTASAEYATSTSQSESAKSASSFAQEVVQRSVESLTERIKESLTTTVVNEIEETNSHGFDNTNGTGHISGIYRWVDKYYLGQVYNYGKRLMFEFIVPEPASFFLHARQVRGQAAGGLTPPVPLADDFSFTDIKPGNYETWVDAYQVANVSPPPPKYKIVARAYDQSGEAPATRTETLSLPEGYLAKEVDLSWSYHFTGLDRFIVVVGQRRLSVSGGEDFSALDDEDSVLPLGIITANVSAYALTIEVTCQRSDEALQAWQLATYNAIVEAYNQQKAAYEAQKAALELNQGVAIGGNNPDQNRRIEQEELRRGSLTLFTDQHFADFDATLTNVAPHGYPEFDVDEAMEEARYVQFFEQAFEWDKMSYLFYPYFWGRKEAWATNSQLGDTDPQFADFLKAGSARVLVPVRRHYELPLLYYKWTGEIWNGGEMPTIHNELYVSIVDEMMSAADADLASATPMGEPWEIKLPTELVLLQEDSVLPDWTDELFDQGGDEPEEPEAEWEPLTR